MEKSAATFPWNDEKLTTVTFEASVTFLKLNKQSRGRSLSHGTEASGCRCALSCREMDVQFTAQSPHRDPQSHQNASGFTSTSGSGVQALQDTVFSSRPPELLRDESLHVTGGGEGTPREQENLPGVLLNGVRMNWTALLLMCQDYA